MNTTNTQIGAGILTSRHHGRILAVDLARGFAALSLPAIHTVLLYSKPEVHKSWLGNILAFLAEPAAAPVFLFLMGFSVALSPSKPVRQVLRRAAALLLAGYLLNWLRLGLPAQAGVMPEELLTGYLVFPRHPYLSLLLTGDILHTAGISLLVVSSLYRWSWKPWPLLLLTVVVAFASPFVRGINTGHLFMSHLAGLFFSEGYRAFFPVFPWLCYPLSGLVAAHFYKKAGSGLLLPASTAGLAILAAGVLLWIYGPQGWEQDFYRGGPGRTLAQTGFVLIWLSAWGFAARFLVTGPVPRLLIFCSRHVTLFYCVQWIVVGWGIPLAGYRSLGLAASLTAIAITTSFTLFVTYIVTVKQKKVPEKGRVTINDQKTLYE
jgi:uncharacterized membrane protein